MLIPFERNLIYLHNFNSSYLSTLLNDVFRFENISGGLLLCASADRTGYILFKNNKVINLCTYINENGSELPGQVPFQCFSETASVDVYVNVIEDGQMIEDINTVFNMPVMYSAPSELADIQKLIGFVESEKISGIMGFKHGSVLNTAVFSDGVFLRLSYYHADTRSYAVEKARISFNNYISLLPDFKPYIFFKRAHPEIKNGLDKKEASFLHSDPILGMFLCYVDMFEIIFRTIKEKISEAKLIDVCGVLFKSLKDKYYPLYSSVSYSKETRTVNWNALYDERRYVSLEYRFAQYHLYLDELLKLLLKIAISIYGGEMNEKVLVKIREYLSMVDKDDLNLKEMTYRVDKILEKLKY